MQGEAEAARDLDGVSVGLVAGRASDGGGVWLTLSGGGLNDRWSANKPPSGSEQNGAPAATGFFMILYKTF